MTTYHHGLAIAAIFRDEATYLKEWIAFHQEVGFTYFYLFNNLSTDSYLQILQPFIDRGVVELTDWPIEHDVYEDWTEIQFLAYERALHFARGKVKWLAILDTDEFLFPVGEERLVDVLSRYENYGGVAVNWQVFGTSRVSKVPENRLLIEMLTLKQAETAPLVKSIVRPEFVASCESAHFMKYRPGYFQVNTDALPFEGRVSPYIQLNALRINHYQVRDEHFLHTQKIPRVRKWWNAQPHEAWETHYNELNTVEDKAIFRFIPAVKARMDLLNV